MNFKEFIEYKLNESDINDAVNDLFDRVKHDGYQKGLEQEVADDWDVKVPLLSRMFKKKYGSDPKDLKVSDDKEKYIEAAKRKAKESRSRFTGEFSKYVGKVFKRSRDDDKEYVFVAWTGKDIHAITIPDSKEIYLRFANSRSAHSFLEKNIL